MAFSVPDLRYPFDALEPHIDARTMEIHHDKHHAAYVSKLNAALDGHADLQGKDVEDLLADLDALPDAIRNAVRNHGGGHANHTLFWDVMGPHGGGGPNGDLADAIHQSFGDFEKFQGALASAAGGQFGSGWGWLVKSGNGLEVMATANQDSPLSVGKTPILGVDVWEHAYYLNYQNRRPDYLAAWWNTVDWDRVAARFAA
ncbi:MAG: superoxide dismutase [Acidobacteriota bacterium]